MTWTFHLRAEAKWSNGDPVTAGDFVFSFRRILTPALGADYANMLYAIKNAQAFNEGSLKDFAKVGVKALDDHTLQIQLEHPTGYFLELCYHQTFLPVHPPTIKKFDAMTRRDSGWDKAGSLVGNGPFVLTKYVLGDVVEVRKNPNYWDAAHVRLNGIRFFPIADVNAEERAFRNGALHLTSTLPSPRIAAYRDSHSPFLRIMPVYGTYFYTINTRTAKGALSDARVRMAMNLAIDRQSLVDHVTRGGQMPAYALTPPSAQYTPQRAIARGRGRGAPLAGRRRLPRWQRHSAHRAALQHLRSPTAPSRRPCRNRGRKILASTCASPTSPRPPGWTAATTPTTKSSAPAGMPIISTPQPSSNFSPATTRWSNPAGRMRTTTNSSSPRATKPTRQSAWRISSRPKPSSWPRLPFIPLYYYTTIFLIRPEVRGYENNLMDEHIYQNIYLDPAATAPEPQK